jgi:hypothetical protein
MSFQAYLDTIKAKTGKDPDDFRALAAERGLVGPQTKAGEVFTWLADEFGLGRGHAMAIFSILQQDVRGGPRSDDERIDKVFSGGKAAWRPTYEALLKHAGSFGPDVGVSPTDTYVSLIRGGKKFAILQPAVAHMDIGIKRKGVEPTDRFTAAGTWNSMLTHRSRVAAADQVDDELREWLRLAYDAASA